MNTHLPSQTASGSPPAPHPLRLVFFVEHFAVTGQGAENDAVLLCRSLAGRGHEVHVIAEDFGDFPGITCHQGLDHIDRHLAAIGPALTVDWGLIHQAHVHRIGGGIHEHFIPYSLEAYDGLARWRKRLGYRAAKHRRLIEHERRLLTNPGARFLAISRFVADHAIAAGADPARVTVLPNAVDTDRFSPANAAAERDLIRRQWGVADDDVVCLFISHNLRLKNLALLARVFRRMGDGPARLAVVSRYSPGAIPRVIAPPPTDRIEHYYGAADLLVHPTFFDSFANVVLEAISCGLPAIVSDRAGIAELLDSGSNGLVLPVAGERHAIDRAWLDAITGLAADADRRRQLGDAGRQLALAHDYAAYLDRLEAALIEADAAR